MRRVDLNCDLGESFGAYSIGMDEELIPCISSANVACGFHAADPCVMRKTVQLAKAHNVAVGAHPGFPDLQGFGRRNMDLSPAEARDCVLYQIGALAAFCRAEGVNLSHVKPHGALYNMAGKDRELALAVCGAVRDFDPSLVLLGLAGSAMLRAADELGLKCAREVFADRAYEEDGSLVARSRPGAMIGDEGLAIARVLRMVTKGEVEAITGKLIAVEVDSICVHGDGPRALAFVREIRGALEAQGVEIAPLAMRG
jgi:5-oxoprolinase (ATP-hydrolysing) subunit A